ncbi:MAG: hypothetical protein ACMG6S_25960 [Byssovorax sp.]
MASSHEDRPLLDPREARRYELARLRALGVEITELGQPRSRALLERFVREFVEPERSAHVLDEVKRQRLGDLDRWMREDCTQRTSGRGCLAWLGPRERGGRCVRLEKRASLSAMEIVVATLEDTWAASWPGVFVNFEAGRALVITIDYEVRRCDRGGLRRSPYR